MTIFLLWIAVNVAFACNVAVPRKREKVIEDYVVRAKFDEKKDLPQLKGHSQLKSIIPITSELKIESKEALESTALRKNHDYGDAFNNEKELEDRDLLVHPHYGPPLPPPPPPPPPPPITYTPSLFALGFITFLILLNSLHTSLLLIEKSKPSLLGSITGPMGRKKRFVVDQMENSKGFEFQERSSEKSFHQK